MADYSLNTPYLILGGVLLVGIIAIFAVFRPQVNDMLATIDQNREAQAVIEKKELFLRTIDQKRAELAAQTEAERRLAVALPADEAFDDVVRIFHTAAQASGGTVTTVQNRSGSEAGELNSQRARGENVVLPVDIVSLAAQVRFNGSYQQLRVFLDQLQKSVRLMDVKSISIRAITEAQDALEAELYVRFYQQGADSAESVE